MKLFFPSGVGALQLKKELFWNDLIRAKYGVFVGGWCSIKVRKGYGVGLWKAIRRWWPLVSNMVSFVVGDGKKSEILGRCLV